MPRLVRFLAHHLAFGVALGIAVACVVTSANVGGLRTLLSGDEHPYVVLFMLTVMFALTFGSLAMGIAIMTLPWGEAWDEAEQDDALQ